MTKVLILENNQALTRILKMMILSLDAGASVYAAERAEAGYKIVMEEQITLLLIGSVNAAGQRGSIEGLQFAKHIRRIPSCRYIDLVIMSDLVDEKLYAYSELHCFRYMEKPFDLNIMKNILMELIVRQQAEEYRQKLMDSTLFVSSEGVLYPIKEDDIIYMEFHSRNSIIITKERSYKTQKAWMEGCLRGLDTNRFISCSRYETVNLDYVESIDFRDGILHLKGMDKMIKIGRNGRKNLQERINFRK